MNNLIPNNVKAALETHSAESLAVIKQFYIDVLDLADAAPGPRSPDGLHYRAQADRLSTPGPACDWPLVRGNVVHFVGQFAAYARQVVSNSGG